MAKNSSMHFSPTAASAPRGGGSAGRGESRLDEAVRQMVDVEAGRREPPEGGSVEIVDDPDIRGIRRSLGLTQRDMADMLGMPIGTLRNWEQGRRKPSNAGKLVLRLLAETRRSVAAQAAVAKEAGDEEEAGVLGRMQLAKAVADRVGLSRSDAQSVIDAVFDTIAAQLKKGGDVRLVGFGNFSVSHRNAKIGRNPRTGEAVEIPAHNVPKFTAGKGLKDAIN